MSVLSRLQLIRGPDVVALFFLFLGFLFVGLVISLPDFPIGDSWAYAWSAGQLAEHGRLQLSDFGSPALIGQLLLSYPISLVFSADPAVLNVFTFVVSFLSACLFYGILRTLGFAPGRAMLGVGVLVCNPIYLAQSVTYDTEVFYLCATFVGVLALLSWERDDGSWRLWLAAAAIGYAVLIRQFAIALVPAGLALSVRRRDWRVSTVLPWLVPVLAFALFEAWLLAVHGVPKAHLWQARQLRERLAEPFVAFQSVLGSTVASLHYLGVFLFPLLLLGEDPAVPRAQRRSGRFWVALLSAAIVVAVTVVGMIGRTYMPYLPNILTLDQAFDALGLTARIRPLLPVATVCSAGLGVLLLFRLVVRWSGARRFLGSAAACLLAFTVVTGLRYDRYLIMVLPLLIPLVLPRSGVVAWRLGACVFTVVILGALSIFYVDQRIRDFACTWSAASSVVAEGYEPCEVDGGFAFNGHHCYQSLATRFGGASSAPFHPGTNPGALVRVRPMAPFEMLAGSREYRCENLPGLLPYVVRIDYGKASSQ